MEERVFCKSSILFFSLLFLTFTFAVMPFFTFLNYWAASLFMLLTSIVLCYCNRNRFDFRKRQIILPVFLLYSFMSLIINRTIGYDAYYFMALTIIFSFIVSYSSGDMMRKMLRVIEVFITIIISVSLILLLLYKFTSLRFSDNQMISQSMNNVFSISSTRFNGMTAGPNLMGMIAAIGCVLYIFHLIHAEKTAERIYSFTLFFLSLYFVIISDSRSAILAILLVFFFLVALKLKRKARIIYISIALLILIFLLINLNSVLSFLSSVSGRDWNTGSSRTDIWKFSLDYIKNRPLIGYAGYSADYIFNEFGVTSAHDIYIDLALRYGIPVMILFMAIIFYDALKIFVACFKEDKIDYKREIIYSLFVLFFVRIIFESTLSICFEMVVFFIVTLTIFNMESKETLKYSQTD